MPLLAQPGLNWSVLVDKLPGAFDYYILTMKEGGEEGSKEALSRCRNCSHQVDLLVCLMFDELSMLGLNSTCQVGYWRGAKS